MSFIIFLISELLCLFFSEVERFIVCKMFFKCLDIVGCICRVFVCVYFIFFFCGRIYVFDFLVFIKLFFMENMYFFLSLILKLRKILFIERLK